MRLRYNDVCVLATTAATELTCAISRLSKASVSPPQKGSFPLDHFHECKSLMEKYMACMKKESWYSYSSRHAWLSQPPIRKIHAQYALPRCTNAQERRTPVCARTFKQVSKNRLTGEPEMYRRKHAGCRDETKAYLQCRMNKGLMTPEDLSNFGLNAEIDFDASQKAQNEYEDQRRSKYEGGFVSGLARGNTKR